MEPMKYFFYEYSLGYFVTYSSNVVNKKICYYYFKNDIVKKHRVRHILKDECFYIDYVRLFCGIKPKRSYIPKEDLDIIKKDLNL